MIFASPIALLWLIPWAGLTVYLLKGRRESTSVPFIELWRTTDAPKNTNRKLQSPPRAIVAMLLALLATIFSLSDPKIRKPGATDHVNMLIDNGVTFTPAGRLTKLIHDASDQLISESRGNLGLTLQWAVGSEKVETDLSDMLSYVTRVSAYPVDTKPVLQAKIASLLQESDDAIVILSDRQLDVRNTRVLQIAPKTAIENVGFVDAAVREFPQTQVMMRIRNSSSQTQSQISIATGLVRIERKIALPERGKSVDYFFDLPEVGPTVKMSIDVSDDLPADNIAFVHRSGTNPRIEVRGDVGEALQRMVEIYSKRRPATQDSLKVMVCDTLFQLPADARAVAMVSASSAMAQLKSPLSLSMDHPIMQSVDWRSVDRATVAATAPGDGWTALVRSNDLVLLAVRDKPVRQVWVGFRSSEFEAQRDYVILWSNIFDYLGEGGACFGYQKLTYTNGELPQRESGIYPLANGSTAALNVLDVEMPEISQLPSRSLLQASATQEWIETSAWLTSAAVALMVISACLLRLA